MSLSVRVRITSVASKRNWRVKREACGLEMSQ